MFIVWYDINDAFWCRQNKTEWKIVTAGEREREATYKFWILHVTHSQHTNSHTYAYCLAACTAEMTLSDKKAFILSIACNLYYYILHVRRFLCSNMTWSWAECGAIDREGEAHAICELYSMLKHKCQRENIYIDDFYEWTQHIWPHKWKSKWKIYDRFGLVQSILKNCCKASEMQWSEEEKNPSTYRI